MRFDFSTYEKLYPNRVKFTISKNGTNIKEDSILDDNDNSGEDTSNDESEDTEPSNEEGIENGD